MNSTPCINFFKSGCMYGVEVYKYTVIGLRSITGMLNFTYWDKYHTHFPLLQAALLTSLIGYFT